MCCSSAFSTCTPGVLSSLPSPELVSFLHQKMNIIPFSRPERKLLTTCYKEKYIINTDGFFALYVNFYTVGEGIDAVPYVEDVCLPLCNSVLGSARNVTRILISRYR